MNRHLISVADLSRDDALLILDTAEELARMSDRQIGRASCRERVSVPV
jgi:aspartate carbamoyltransferase catalytic subunit